MTITIKNKLEIMPGNVIVVPGCEPTSSFTSDVLAANIDCNASIIDLNDAIEAIREVSGETPRIIHALSPSGFPSTGRFLELPSGPPTEYGCDNRDGILCTKQEDWYQILKDNAKPINPDELEDDDPRKLCVGFNYSGTRRDTGDDKWPEGERFRQPFKETANFHKATDPEIRPNSDPIGGFK
jgi:hypothetical protein